MYDGTSLLEGGQTAAGSILTWIKNNPVSYTHLDVYKRQQSGLIIATENVWKTVLM